MRVTGWRLPPAPAESGAELRASGLDAPLVVIHATSTDADRLFALFAQCLYGPPYDGPGEVTVWDGSASRAVRPGDQAAAGEGPTPAARQSEAARGWAHLAGHRPAGEEVVRERERLVRALGELDRRLTHKRPTPGDAVIDLTDGAQLAELAGANAQADAGVPAGNAEPLADLAVLEEGLAEDDEHGALATQQLGQMAAELGRFAGLPSRAELTHTRQQLGELEAAIETSDRAGGDVEAAATTIAVLERALAQRSPAVGGRGGGRGGRVRRLVQPAALVGATLLIAVATALLIADRPGAGAIVGLVAFAVGLVALFAPTAVPTGEPRPALPDPAQIGHHLGLARQRLVAGRDALVAAELATARLTNELGLQSTPTAAQLAERHAELAEAEAARRDADKLANTVDAALVDLETKRANARQQALAAAARRAGLEQLPDTTLPGQPDGMGGGEARRRHLRERLELTRRVLASALTELEGRHPTLLTRAAARFAEAADGVRIDGVDDRGGPVIVADGATADGRRPAEDQWALLADLCLTVEATNLAAGERAVPLVLGGVRLGGSPGQLDRVAGVVAAEADVRQVVAITTDTASYQRLLAARSDAAGVDLASIRVLVTPPE